MDENVHDPDYIGKEKQIELVESCIFIHMILNSGYVGLESDILPALPCKMVTLKRFWVIGSSNIVLTDKMIVGKLYWFEHGVAKVFC